MFELFRTITHFGTLLLLIPMSLILAGWLWRHSGWRDAALWSVCVAGVGVVMALLKIYFATCQLWLHGIHSPSGHSAFSAIAYGGFAVIVTRGSERWWAPWARAAAALWVLLIGISRVVMHAHTTIEVVIGFVIGGLAVWVFQRYYSGRVRPPIVVGACLLAAIALASMLMPDIHGITLEPYLAALAGWLRPHAAWLCGPPL